jgi:hypothetical protein
LCIHSDGLAVCRSTSWHTDWEETSLGMQVDDLELKRRFSPYVERCVLLLKANGVTADLFVEVLGTLANLCVPEFDFQALAQRHDLLNFLAKYAKPDAVDDDILLEVIMFVGVFVAAFHMLATLCTQLTLYNWWLFNVGVASLLYMYLQLVHAQLGTHAFGNAYISQVMTLIDHATDEGTREGGSWL